jgi:cysteinyl-tRNA synthetase
MDLVLGLGLVTIDRRDLSIPPANAILNDGAVEALLEKRANARAAKDYAVSDAIRDELVGAGVELMDGDALRWEWKPQLSS